MIPPSAHVTELLVAWSDGDKSAEKELYSLVYRELRRLAHRYMSAGESWQHPADHRACQ